MSERIQQQHNEWAFSTIGKELRLVNGFGFKPEHWKKSGIPIIRIQNLNDYSAPFDYVQQHVDERFQVSPGDLLFAWSGSRGTSFGPFLWKRGHAVLNQHIFNIRFSGDCIDKKFSYYWLKYLVEEIEQMAHGSAGLVHITKRELEKFRFLLIALSEQRKIANILTTVDNLIEKTEALIAKYQTIKQGMMHDLFTRGVDARGHLRPTCEEAPELYKKSEMGWIPKEWEVVPVASVCDAVIDCKNRTPPESDEGYPVVKTTNIRSGRLRTDGITFTDETSYVTWTERGKPRAGDVLITREAPVGEVCMIPEGIFPVCLGQRIMMYQSDKRQLNSNFLLFSLLSANVQKRLLELAGGSTVGHVRVDDIRNLSIPYCSLREQILIGDSLCRLDKRIETEQCHLMKLNLIKTGLMQDLLTGKVRVNIEKSGEIAA